MTPHLFDHWDEVAERVAAATAVRLFVDFDGTLVPLCETPDQVTLSEGTRRALQELVRHRRVAATIISGRRRGDLVRYVGLPGLQYWGLHGWERRAGCSLPREAAITLSRARDSLTSVLRDVPGVHIEDKGLAFSVHVRGASRPAERRARELLRHVLAREGVDMHVLPGKKAWDVLPRHIPGKGSVVRGAIQKLRGSFLPVYVGDDVGDEPAIVALEHGITVHVGKARSTHARYRLADPNEVRAFMERLEGELRTSARARRSRVRHQASRGSG